MAQYQPTESDLLPITFAGLATGDMSADVTSDAVYINGTNNFCVEYVIDPTDAVGSMELQGSNDGANFTMIVAQPIAADTSGGQINYDKYKGRYVRLAYVSTSGSATLTSASINLGVS